jgi:hypothetical protein
MSAKPTRRKFTAPNNAVRCKGDVTLRDGSVACCMHRAQRGREYCRQHPSTDDATTALKALLSEHEKAARVFQQHDGLELWARASAELSELLYRINCKP